MISAVRSAKKAKTGGEGFTLLEILVAVTVLAVAFTGLFRLFGGTLHSITVSEKYARAAILSEQKMTEILFDQNFEPGAGGGTFANNPAFSWESGIQKYETPIGRIEAEEVETKDLEDVINTYRVEVSVSWDEGGKAKSLGLVTLKTLVEENVEAGWE